MDKRIGCGLSMEEAIKVARDELGGKQIHFTINTEDHRIVWAELRDDGWRVYLPYHSSEG